MGNLCSAPNLNSSRNLNSKSSLPMILEAVTGTEISKQYKLKKILGHGSYGITYVCKDRKTGTKYACKTISKNRLTTQHEVENLKREIGVMHFLPPHPNIVRLEDLFEDRRNIYMVIELCQGGDLFERLVAKGRAMKESEAAEIIKTMVQTVKFCHSYGVVHRDLKPENFLFSDKSDKASLKLIDFGFAAIYRPGHEFRDIAGSTLYMAPEVFKRSAGPEFDIWNIGVILYNLLSRGFPFQGFNQKATMYQIGKVPITFDGEPWPKVSKNAKDLILKLLTRDPKKRIMADKVLTHQWFKSALGRKDI